MNQYETPGAPGSVVAFASRHESPVGGETVMVASRPQPEFDQPPPVSTNRCVVRANIQSDPLDVADIEELVDTPEAGACVSFVGRVRRHDAAREVVRLEYSSHPTADDVARRIADEIASGFDGVCAIALSHRVGELAVGEVAVAVAVSAGHRGQAFDACRAAVETVKRELPIWKHQFFADGTDEWVGSA